MASISSSRSVFVNNLKTHCKSKVGEFVEVVEHFGPDWVRTS